MDVVNCPNCRADIYGFLYQCFPSELGTTNDQSVRKDPCSLGQTHTELDIDLYHWSTPRFSSVWQDTLSVLVARGRARVSVSASAADWPKRIRDMQYVDHDDFAVAH